MVLSDGKRSACWTKKEAVYCGCKMSEKHWNSDIMLKLFFNRFSLIPRWVEGIGILFFFLTAPQWTRDGVFLLFSLLYLFLRFCATKRWYPEAPRGSGVELHFQKILVPSVYALCLTMVTYFFFQTRVFLWISLPIFIFLSVVNGILLYLRACDKSKEPINALTRNTH